jgi:hypothetical protein
MTFEQPRPTDAPEGPQAYAGSGPALSPFFYTMGGLVMIGRTYQGDGRVAIRVRDANGAVVEQVATFAGSKGIGLTPASTSWICTATATGR